MGDAAFSGTGFSTSIFVLPQFYNVALSRGLASLLKKCRVTNMMSRPALFACCLFILTSSTSSAAGPKLTSPSQKVAAPTTGVELGLGWDSRTGRIVPNRCVNFAPVRERGQDIKVKLTQIHDSSDIMDTLDVSAGASVSTMYGSGSARASFASSSNVSSSHDTLLLRATVTNGILFAGPVHRGNTPRYAFPSILESPKSDFPIQSDDLLQDQDEVSLKEWAEELAKGTGSADGNASEFKDHCGDSFVAGLYSGAEILATLSFEETSSATSKEVQAALEAQFGVATLNAAAGARNAEKLENSRLEIDYVQLGGAEGLIPIDFDGFKEKLTLLPLEASRAPRFHSMMVVPYDSLASWPTETNLAEGHSETLNEVIANHYWVLSSLNAEIEQIRAMPDAYSLLSGYNFDELRHFQDEVNSQRKHIKEAVAMVWAGKRPPDAPKLSVSASTVASVPQMNCWQPSGGDDTGLQGPMRSVVEGIEPFGQCHPNTLYLNLPLPKSIIEAERRNRPQQRVEAWLPRLVVHHYVGRHATQICRLDPSDSECLSNAQLLALESQVRVQAAGSDLFPLDMVLWLDADDESSVVSAAQEDVIAAWRDKSPNRLELRVRGEETPGPKREPVDNGAHHMVRFKPSWDSLCGERSIDLTSGTTIFVVGSNDKRRDYNGLFSLRDSRGQSNAALAMYWQQGSNQNSSGNLAFYSTHKGERRWVTKKNSSPQPGRHYLFTVTATPAGVVRFWVNRTAKTQGIATKGEPPYLPDSAKAPCVGQGTGGPKGILDGTIGEIIVYRRALDDRERRHIETYLWNKWF